MPTKPRSSRYGPNEEAEVHKARVKTGQTFATFQKQATLKEARKINSTTMPLPPPSPVETWADHMGVNAGPYPSPQAIEKILALGLRWVSISPERGWNTPEETKKDIARLHDLGLKVHAVAQESGHDYTNVVANTGPFAAYALSLADAGADAVTIGNEWNNPMFWKNLHETMRGPALIHTACITAIRQNHPDLPVYMVGWSPGGGVWAPAVCQGNLGYQMRLVGSVAPQYTGVSHHPYSFNSPLTFGMPDHKEWNSFQQTPDVYVKGVAAGIHGPMSLTEYGVPSAGTQETWPNQVFSEDYQAKIMEEYFGGFQEFREDGIPIAYMGLSTAIDGDAVTRPIEGSLGMFRKDGTEKPAAEIVRHQAKKVW